MVDTAIVRQCRETSWLTASRFSPMTKDLRSAGHCVSCECLIWSVTDCLSVKEKLGYFIQDRTADAGHSSAEDAKAALDLLKWRVREDGEG